MLRDSELRDCELRGISIRGEGRGVDSILGALFLGVLVRDESIRAEAPDERDSIGRDKARDESPLVVRLERASIFGPPASPALLVGKLIRGWLLRSEFSPERLPRDSILGASVFGASTFGASILGASLPARAAA